MKIKNALGLVALGICAANLAAQSVNTVIEPQANLFSAPAGVAVDASENIYVTDSDLHRIIQFTRTNGTLKQLSGVTGQPGSADGPITTARFFSPEGIVAARGGLFVADSGNHTIRFIDLNAKTVVTVAGLTRSQGNADGAGSTATFSSPKGLAADTAGNVYIADSRNGAIRILDTANNVRTLTTGFAEPTGISITEHHQVIVADRAANQVYIVETNGSKRLIAGSGAIGADDGPALESTFSAPEAVMWLGTNFGTVVSDSGNHVLRRITYAPDAAQSVVELYSGIPGLTNRTDGLLADALFNGPVAMARYQSGFLLLEDGNKDLRQVLTQPQLPRIGNPSIGYVEVVTDPDTGQPKLQLFPVTDQTFENDVVIGIVGDLNVVHYFTSGRARLDLSEPDVVPDPRTVANPETAPPFRNGGPPSDMPQSIVLQTLPELSIKAQSRAEGRTASDVVQATFRFKVSAPRIDASNLNAILLRAGTEDAVMYYTLDGSEPTEGFAPGHATRTNAATLGPKLSGETIALILTGEPVTLKVRGFRDGYRPSDVASIQLSQENVTPNRISFGFTGGEGSSDFVASPGQRFFAPITLSILPGQQMHGLQFSVRINNGTGVAPAQPQDYAFAFESLLKRGVDVAKGVYADIPPTAFGHYETEVFSNNVTAGTNVLTFTNFVPVLTNLLATNFGEGLLNVGWLERHGTDILYDSTIQTHLIQFSMVHDTVFISDGGKVLVGGYSFVIPANAETGSTYQLSLERPSGTVGLSGDVYIEAPGRTNPYTELRAERDVRVGRRPYIVGDVAPFRWLNAGDFGDTNIVNNDVMQIFQSAAFGINTPPQGSDFFDAMDTCCNDINGAPVVTGSIFNGSDTNTINSIVFGNGILDINDVFVAFRRGLDKSLMWYARYWGANGLEATNTPNMFRGASDLFSSSGSIRALSTSTAADSSLTLSIAHAQGNAGATVSVPVSSSVSGSEIQALMFKVRVRALHGAPPVSAVKFTSSLLGSPTFTMPEGGTAAAYAWLTPLHRLMGEAEIGSIEFSIPANAPSDATYLVQLEHVSATGDGVNKHHVTSYSGVLNVGEGAAVSWNDAIPSEWRAQHFGAASHPASAPDADPDQDGVSNEDEFFAGTSPVRTLSVLALKVEANNARAGVALRWQAESGKRYRIESSSDLGSTRWNLAGDDVIGSGSEMTFEISEAAASQFFRVRVIQ